MNEPTRFQSPEYLAVLSPEQSPMRCACTTQGLTSMRQAAEQVYPQEACGLLIGSLGPDGWGGQEIRQVANLNTERAADRFQLDPDAYRRIDQELRGTQKEIIGVFHSHPDCPAKPSPTDLASAWDGFVYPIISVSQGRTAEIRWWTLGPDVRFQAVVHVQEEA